MSDVLALMGFDVRDWDLGSLEFFGAEGEDEVPFVGMIYIVGEGIVYSMCWGGKRRGKSVGKG